MPNWLEPTLSNEEISSLFDCPTSACVATPSMYVATPRAEELAVIRKAGEKRRREFRAGRAAARHALEELVGYGPSIPARADRAPQWPAGVVGSISHCDTCCIAVVARSRDAASIGIDVEAALPLPPDLISIICSNGELAQLPQSEHSTAMWGKLAFCAKEAFYKAHYALCSTFFSFLDATVTFTVSDASQGSFNIIINERSSALIPPPHFVTGRWAIAERLIVAGATI